MYFKMAETVEREREIHLRPRTARRDKKDEGQVISLRIKLNQLYQKFDAAYLELDPLDLVRQYQDPRDQEIAGFIAAALAVGQYRLIRKAVTEVLSRMGGSPFAFVSAFDPLTDKNTFSDFVYRFYRGRDIGLLISMMAGAVREFGSLESCFLRHYQPTDPDIGKALSGFVRRLLSCDVRPFYEQMPSRGSGIRHFLADPADGSTCKRLNLFLRWMIRKDHLDLGIWKSVSAAKLVIPVDTHIARLVPHLGLTRRKSADWKMAVEITESLRSFDPEDPVKYDFALCTIGKLRACPDPPDRMRCADCPLIAHCEG